MVRVFVNGLEDQGSIPGPVLPKAKKLVFDTSLLNTPHYKEWIQDKCCNPGKGVVPSPRHRCGSY